MKRFLISLMLLLTSTVFLFAQNSCEEALPLAAGTYTVDTIDGTPIASSWFWINSQTATEWYYYENTSSEEYAIVNITTFLPQNAGGDTRISVLSGNCDALVCETYNDDVFDVILLSEVAFTVPPLTTYIVAFDNRWSSAGFDFRVNVSFVTPDCSTNFPFTENFESSIDFSNCYTTESVDTDTTSWSYQTFDFGGDGTEDGFAMNGAGTTEENDYLISPALQLNGGTSYSLTTHFNGSYQGTPSNQYLTAVLLDAPNSSANVITTIFDATNVPNTGVVELTFLEMDAIERIGVFTPDTDGIYYVAFIATSQAPYTNGRIIFFDYTIIEGVVDEDGDGFPASVDCDDTDSSINPDAEDIPGNGIDEDCDGEDAPLPPENDLCSNAIELSCSNVGGVIIPVTGTNLGASDIEGVGGNCGISSSAVGVWYTFEGNGNDVTLFAHYTNIDFGPRITIFTGACDSLVCEGNNEGLSGSSNHIWDSEAGTTYYIYVSGKGNNKGNFELSTICGSVGVEPLTKEDIKLYPNPAHDYAKIDLGDNYNQVQSVSIIDNLGKTLLVVDNIEQPIVTLSTGNLVSGVYFVSILKNNERIVLELVVLNR